MSLASFGKVLRSGMNLKVPSVYSTRIPIPALTQLWARPHNSIVSSSRAFTAAAAGPPANKNIAQAPGRRDASSISEEELEDDEVYDELDEGEYTPTVATVRKPAPYFKAAAVINGEFKDVSLDDYAGRWLVLLFYPLDFTFVCPTELVAFSDRIEEFKKLNTDLVGISIDSKYSHLAWTRTARKDGGIGKVNFPLVADISKEISRDYGVLLPEDGHSLRGLFLVDPKSNVRHILMNDTQVGRSVDETLRTIQAFQFNEKHGEVCPADWTPGQATMKADPNLSKAYFQKKFKA